ncbi:N-acetylglucosamine kinase-like BadF-type ATPase [Paenibacillus shirakamiensis]|uniref:N-acetylglucosamine kinase-like BadF-type ATPase n=1 Tax=Paenibacillus shirakamiensis TaxID=1265935 RepID=A0ABS4JEQ4_9BACL|nr:BadF/BadG/BcrA/BcrD ATPase family protein [Paenibacillus shirakamiensis]MBP2000195.1 N-acetylglucosamine kinase-like BadF-type ATPase [Paenibacillus shirakamiensis]
MGFYLGMDAGGSKTIAVITDSSGKIVGRGFSGCGNHQLGANMARSNIEAAIEQAFAMANLGLNDISYALFGLAGADREQDYVILRPMIGQLGFAEYDIVCDTVIGLRAGTRQPYGVVLICGTGTNCLGIDPNGHELQCGGFGYEYGDFGGGKELAIEVFRTVIRAWEGREKPTLLTELVLQMLNYPSVQALFHDYLNDLRPVPKDLTKLLFIAADQGDDAALGILQRQGKELGIAARTVIDRLQMQSIPLEVVLVGSVLTRNAGQYITPYIQELIPTSCSLHILTVEPVAGAVLLAMEKHGLPITDDIYQQLEAQLTLEGMRSR